MKSLLCIGVFLCCTVTASFSQIINGGFEDWPDSTKPPTGWTAGLGSNNVNGNGWARKKGHSGKYSFQFQELPIEESNIISGKFKLLPSSKFLSFWYSTSYDNSTPLVFHYKIIDSEETIRLPQSDWAQFSIDISLKAKTDDSISIDFTVPRGGPPPDFYGAIYCLIDDVSLDSVKDFILETKDNFFSISPNPISSHANLKYHLDRSGPIHSSIFDITGREVLKLPSVSDASGDGAIPFDCDNLPNGLYYLRFEAGETVMMRKIIVQH